LIHELPTLQRLSIFFGRNMAQLMKAGENISANPEIILKPVDPRAGELATQDNILVGLGYSAAFPLRSGTDCICASGNLINDPDAVSRAANNIAHKHISSVHVGQPYICTKSFCGDSDSITGAHVDISGIFTERFCNAENKIGIASFDLFCGSSSVQHMRMTGIIPLIHTCHDRPPFLDSR
jgi:hypothetical protein